MIAMSDDASPFFSVLLPTKNRAEILADAIRSVMAQTCEDWELVISDNSDPGQGAEAVVAEFDDPRIRCLRTAGDLPMHDNWENAFVRARGDYVLMVEDKMRLVPNALEILRTHIEKLGSVVVSYDVRFAKGDAIPAPRGLPAAVRWTSADTVALFRKFQQRFFNLLPKGLDSAAPRELLQSIKDGSPTGYIFSHVAPDYASGFQVLSAVDEFWYIDEPLAYIPNNWMWRGKYSVGSSNYKKEDMAARWKRELPVTTEQIYEHAPAKSRWLWINNVLYDYHTKYRPVQDHPPISRVDYFAFCWIVILMGRRLGADMVEEQRAVREGMRKETVVARLRVWLNLGARLVHIALRMVASMFRR